MNFLNKINFRGWIPDQVRNDKHKNLHINGFTFVELLVVITIIGIIFASGIVAFTSISMKSRDTRRRADLEAIRQTLEMCRSLTGVYPDSVYTAGGISCSVSGPNLMKVVPTDPKPDTNCSSQYAYVRSTTTTYTLTACQEAGGTYQVASP